MNKMGLNRFDYKTDYIKFLAVALSSDAVVMDQGLKEMFEKQIYYYKLGQSVRYVVPQFDEYYIEEDVLEFCIKEDVHLNLIYKH